MKKLFTFSLMIILFCSMILTAFPVKADDANLALPFRANNDSSFGGTGWGQGGWGGYLYHFLYSNLGFDPHDNTPFPDYFHTDNSLGMSPAIRVDYTTSEITSLGGSSNRELDDYNNGGSDFTFPAHAGQYVYFGVWANQPTSNIGVPNGVRSSDSGCIGFDVWGENGFINNIWDQSSFESTSWTQSFPSAQNAFVPIGSGWVWIYVYVQIPQSASSPYGFSTPVTSICPIIYGGLGQSNFGEPNFQMETSSCWFSGAELYISDFPLEVSPSPTPNSNASPTPSLSPFPTWGGIIISDETPTPVPSVGASLQGGVSFNLPLMAVISVVGVMAAIAITGRRRY